MAYLGQGPAAIASFTPGQQIEDVILADYAELTQAKGNLGATPEFDLTAGQSITGTVDQNITSSTIVNPVAADDNTGFTLKLTNGGAFTIVWPTSFKWPDATAPTLTAAGTDTVVGYTVDGGTTWNVAIAMTNNS